jgi:hypothetical protein
VTISVGGEKALDKIQRFISPEETRKTGTYFNIIKATYVKPIGKNHTKWRKTEIISSKVKNETRVSTLSTLIQYSA